MENHKITTFAIFYTVSGNILQNLIASGSSTPPDLIQMSPGRLFFRKHRGTSHNPLFWFLALPFLYFFLQKAPLEVSLIPLAGLSGPEALFGTIATMVFLHLAGDPLSGSGIPLWGGKRIALKVYKTFTLSELATVFTVLLFCGLSLAAKRVLFL